MSTGTEALGSDRWPSRPGTSHGSSHVQPYAAAIFDANMIGRRKRSSNGSCICLAGGTAILSVPGELGGVDKILLEKVLYLPGT
jgi:hypothetical protein